MDIALFVIVIIFLAIIVWRLFQSKEPKGQDNQSLLLLQNQITELNRTLETKLSESAKAITYSTNNALTQANKSAELIERITKELANVGEGQRQVANVADQLKSLQDILKNSKQRGGIGEQFLKNILENVFSPAEYEMQYGFKD